MFPHGWVVKCKPLTACKRRGWRFQSSYHPDCNFPFSGQTKTYIVCSFACSVSVRVGRFLRILYTPCMFSKIQNSLRIAIQIIPVKQRISNYFKYIAERNFTPNALIYIYKYPYYLTFCIIIEDFYIIIFCIIIESSVTMNSSKLHSLLQCFC